MAGLSPPFYSLETQCHPGTSFRGGHSGRRPPTPDFGPEFNHPSAPNFTWASLPPLQHILASAHHSSLKHVQPSNRPVERILLSKGINTNPDHICSNPVEFRLTIRHPRASVTCPASRQQVTKPYITAPCFSNPILLGFRMLQSVGGMVLTNRVRQHPGPHGGRMGPLGGFVRRSRDLSWPTWDTRLAAVPIGGAAVHCCAVCVGSVPLITDPAPLSDELK